MVSGWSPGNVRPVRVHVAFTPGEATRVPTGIVVDVLRATSTIVQALDAGYGAVYCCAEIEEAQALKEDLGDAVLGGERGGDPPARLRPRELPARASRATSGYRCPHDDERHPRCRAGRGELRPGPRREHAEPGRRRGCGARARRGRGGRLRRPPRGSERGRCLLRRADRRARGRRANRSGRERPRAGGVFFECRGGVSAPCAGSERPLPRKTSSGARRKASPRSSRGLTPCAERPRASCPRPGGRGGRSRRDRGGLRHQRCPRPRGPPPVLARGAPRARRRPEGRR
jgi:hypothetical protein